MLKVLSVTIKRRHITEVALSGGAVLQLDSDYALKLGIHEGDTFSKAQIEQIKNESDIIRAKSRAIWYLSGGDLSEKALRQKLVRAGFPENAIDAAIARMHELGFLNDERLAKHLSANLINANCSKRAAQQKLILKGIPSSVAKQTLNDFDCDERKSIRNIIDKRYKNKLVSEDGVKKVFAALIRRGFSYADVKNVLRAYSSEIDDCEEI